ncbi:MAG: hypothetical protein GY906_36925 [bacterium]|nr:hypothetical protein [bacterium]
MSFPPSLSDLPAPPRRVILHWTAGRHLASWDEKKHYHIVIEHNDQGTEDPSDDAAHIAAGTPIERNMRDLRGVPTIMDDPQRGYAPHTARFNSYSIGVSLAGMRGAIDRREDDDGVLHPRSLVDPGTTPITRLQVLSMIGLCVSLSALYNLEVSEDTFFTHFEAQYIHGVKQKQKWDITWIPGREFCRSNAGPWIRDQIIRQQKGQQVEL